METYRSMLLADGMHSTQQMKTLYRNRILQSIDYSQYWAFLYKTQAYYKRKLRLLDDTNNHFYYQLRNSLTTNTGHKNAVEHSPWL